VPTHGTEINSGTNRSIRAKRKSVFSFLRCDWFTRSVPRSCRFPCHGTAPLLLRKQRYRAFAVEKFGGTELGIYRTESPEIGRTELPEICRTESPEICRTELPEHT